MHRLLFALSESARGRRVDHRRLPLHRRHVPALVVLPEVVRGGRVRWAVEVEGGEIVTLTWDPELGAAPADYSIALTSKEAMDAAVAYVERWTRENAAQWERIWREARMRGG